MRKHFSSLRSQMLLLTTGTVLAVVILATVFYSSAQRMSEKKAATFVHSMLVQLGDSLDRIGNEMSYPPSCATASRARTSSRCARK